MNTSGSLTALGPTYVSLAETCREPTLVREIAAAGSIERVASGRRCSSLPRGMDTAYLDRLFVRTRRALASRRAASLAMAAIVGVTAPWVLLPGHASAQTAPAPCDAWQVEYALSASLELSDTPLGQGNGVYPIGPGKLVLRFEDRGGQPGGRAKMVSYEMRQAFQVVSKNLLGTTTVATDATTRKAPDACGVAAEGRLNGTALEWSTVVRGFRTDGFLTCEGTFCGKFGAPPPGRSALTQGPAPVSFQPFRYSADMKTFTMASTFVSKTDSPKQTAHLAFSGRETARTCVPTAPCP
jgi:hypothetical protein